MITVHKYPLPIQDLVVLNLPEGAIVLKIECQRGEPMVWALVDTEADHEYRAFQVFGTGANIVAFEPKGEWEGLLDDDCVLDHVATFQHHAFVWHVFERVAPE